MKFTKINIDTWNRKEIYLNYKNITPCTYSMSVNLDITNFFNNIKENNLKFFSTVLYAVSYTVNKHKEFRMDLDEDKNIGFYDVSNPNFTIFHKDTESFTTVWTQYSEDFYTFIKNYENDMEKYQDSSKNSKPIITKNYFNLSCIPWTSFTGFNLNLQNGYEYFAPIFTIGKYFVNEEKTLLPMAIQVNHAVCDGFHISRFINDLQELLNSLKVDFR